jgi:hypothetical protein
LERSFIPGSLPVLANLQAVLFGPFRDYPFQLTGQETLQKLTGKAEYHINALAKQVKMRQWCFPSS